MIGTEWDWPHSLLIYYNFQTVRFSLRLIQNPAVCSLFDLQSNSEVWIVRAWQNNYDAPLGLNNSTLQHSHTGVSTKKYNLIKEATANGMKSYDIYYSVLDRIHLFALNLGFHSVF